jgi:hypothetical protein
MFLQPSRHSKLEKADILEMTVKHLQNVQRAQLAIAVASDPRVLARFKNGFAECATEASRYVARIDGADPGLKTRMATHLTACVSGLQSLTPLAFTAMAAPSLAAVDVNIPTATLLQRAAMHSGHQMVDAAASGVVPAGPGEALPTGASPGASLAAKQDVRSPLLFVKALNHSFGTLVIVSRSRVHRLCTLRWSSFASCATTSNPDSLYSSNTGVNLGRGS